MTDAAREIFLEQVNAIRQTALDLQRRMETIAVAETVSRDYVAKIVARCDAARGLMQAQDWE